MSRPQMQRTDMCEFTHSLLQQLFQAVDVWSVPPLPLHHHTVTAGRRCGNQGQKFEVSKKKGARAFKDTVSGERSAVSAA